MKMALVFELLSWIKLYFIHVLISSRQAVIMYIVVCYKHRFQRDCDFIEGKHGKSEKKE